MGGVFCIGFCKTNIINVLCNDRKNLNMTAVVAKDIDNIRFTEAYAEYASMSRSDAKSSNNEINFLLSESEVFEYGDPRTEQYLTLIEKANAKYNVGLTKGELKEKTRLSIEIIENLSH